MKKKKIILLILVFIVISLVSFFLWGTDITRYIKKISNNMNAELVETTSKYEISSVSGSNLNVLIIFENTNGIEKIIDDTEEFICNGKRKVSFDRTYTEGEIIQFIVKPMGQAEETHTLVATAKPVFTATERIDNVEGPLVDVNIEYPSVTNIKQLYSIDEGTTWQEYSGTINFLKYQNIKAKIEYIGTKTIERVSSTPIRNASYGSKVNYTTTNDVSNWKLFYKNDETEDIYLILDDYLPIAKMPSVPSVYGYGTHQVYFERNIRSSVPITDLVREKFMFLSNLDSGSNYRRISRLLDTSAWSVFANGVSGTQNITNGYAIGTPTLEMWAASYNQYYVDDYFNVSTTSTGYYRVNGSDSTSFRNKTIYNTRPNMYVPHKNTWNGSYGYYLTAPINGIEVQGILTVRDEASITDSLCAIYASQIPSISLRPVVYIPNTYKLQWDSTTNSFNIVEK